MMDVVITRQKRKWDHTAPILTLLANMNPDRQKAAKLKDFHPYFNEIRTLPTEDDASVTVLRSLVDADIAMKSAERRL